MQAVKITIDRRTLTDLHSLIDLCEVGFGAEFRFEKWENIDDHDHTRVLWRLISLFRLVHDST